jgi:hypothetical protein
LFHAKDHQTSLESETESCGKNPETKDRSPSQSADSSQESPASFEDASRLSWLRAKNMRAARPRDAMATADSITRAR